jgi:hypothetical protein
LACRWRLSGRQPGISSGPAGQREMRQANTSTTAIIPTIAIVINQPRWRAT